MTPEEMKKRSCEMLEEITQPDNLARIYNYVYRHFLKDGIEKAPRTAATVQSAQGNTYRKQNTTPAASRQELLEEIRHYAKCTPLDDTAKRRYDLPIKECFALGDLAKESPTKAIILAFEYGRAKGYRAGSKATGRRG